MRNCAFLTMADPTGFVIDDELAYAPFAGVGWRVRTVPWTGESDWSAFDAVVVRSTWDYHLDRARFLRVLDDIVAAGVPLLNPLALIRWNLAKTYLLELAECGVPIVPTLVRERLAPGDLSRLFEELDADELVVKPVVGANAAGAFRLRRDSLALAAGEVDRRYAATSLLAQPFAKAIVDEGEYSLFYFNGVYSHAIRKTPARGDYRVQEEHGAAITPLEVPGELRGAGDRAISVLPECPLYARVDLVRANDGDGFWLMELELIEPSLYLRMDPAAPARFAQSFAVAVATATAR